MTYPMNTAITYTASAQTSGTTGHSFGYAWTFDDGGTANTASAAHTWTTGGLHLATVVATDTTTLGTATASKEIQVQDWSTFTWTNANQKIVASTSSGPAFYYKLVKYGTKLINYKDYYTKSAVVSYDTLTGVRSENLQCLGAPGNYNYMGTAAFPLTVGRNAGKILVCLSTNPGGGGFNYGFLDPNTLSFTLSQYPNWMAKETYDSGAGRSQAIDMGNNTVVVLSRTLGGTPTAQTYDMNADTWTALPNPPYYAYLDAILIGGNIFCIRDNSITTDVWNPTVQGWQTGPTLPAIFADSAFRAVSNSAGASMLSSGSPNAIITWNGTFPASFTNGTVYPLATQGITSTGNSTVLMDNGNNGIMDVSAYGNSATTQYVKNLAYFNSTWIQAGNWTGFGHIYRSEYINGRIWIADSTGNLWYSSPF